VPKLEVLLAALLVRAEQVITTEQITI